MAPQQSTRALDLPDSSHKWRAAPKPSLLYVVNDLRYFCTHRLELARAALGNGFAVSVAAPPSAYASTLMSEGIRVHPIALDRWAMNPLGEAGSISDLTRLYRRLRPDVAHHVTIKPVIYGSIAARLAGTPSVVNAVPGLGYMFSGDGPLGGFRRVLAESLYRFAMQHANQFTIFQNESDLTYFKQRILRNGERVINIPGSGVDLQTFRPVQEGQGRPVIMMIARLIEAKGIEDFVKAARAVRSKGTRARFVVVGPEVPGNPDRIPERKLEDWRQEGLVEFWGFRQDIYECLKQSHIICLPARHREGLPRVFLEAAACGRPVITTPVPGCREYLQDGVNGIIVPTRSPGTLASAIDLLVQDGELRRSMGKNARALLEVSNLSQEKVIESTLWVYRQLLGVEPIQRAAEL